MARYQVILAYDGTAFSGYQRQKSARTVQGEVESALTRLGWTGKTILSAGRTDCGVHAGGQVAAFDLDWHHGADELGRAINALLPEDVAVRQVNIVDDAFHPRYRARSRRYQYRLYCSRDRDPLLERFAWRVWPEADLGLLEQAALILTGAHDFSAFGNPPKAGGNPVRTVFEAAWQPEAGGLQFEVKANAFLYHMVRRMVYLQVMVGQSRLSLVDFALAVQQAQPQIPGLAPAKGLVLVEVEY